MNYLEFSVRMVVFAAAFYYILEYVFVCELHNTVSLAVLFCVITGVICIFWLYGKKLSGKNCC